MVLIPAREGQRGSQRFRRVLATDRPPVRREHGAGQEEVQHRDEEAPANEQHARRLNCFVPSSRISLATSATVSSNRSSARLTWIILGPALSAACSSALRRSRSRSLGEEAFHSLDSRSIVVLAAENTDPGFF